VDKYLVISVDPHEPRTSCRSFFDLMQITNNGAAFGSFKNNNTFLSDFLVALIFV
jgi:lipoprotein signal peptidase